MIRVGEKTRVILDCILDSGAPLTVFPRIIWKRFENDIEWLTLPDARAAVSWTTNLRGRTGGRIPCRLGRGWVEAFDLENPRQSLLGMQVLAQFEQQKTSDDRVLVGLHGGILERRRLIVEPDLRQAWLEDR
jgi:hypothetical protein